MACFKHADGTLPQIEARSPLALRKEALKLGWVKFHVDPAIALEEVAAQFGKPIRSAPGRPYVSRLIPRDKASARQNTLSRCYGLNAFPFHTDGAAFPLPPRFILLRSPYPDTSRRPTIVARVTWPEHAHTHYNQLANTMFVVGGPNHSFYSPILSVSTSFRVSFVRFNPLCMVPLTASAGKAFESVQALINTSELSRVFWGWGTTILIDNWRVLHCRGEAECKDEFAVRLLERCYIT